MSTYTFVLARSLALDSDILVSDIIRVLNDFQNCIIENSDS